jgi:hypothetical protein
MGQDKGHKLGPASVAREMLYVKNRDGTRMFTADEPLTETQIRSHFSRQAEKL